MAAPNATRMGMLARVLGLEPGEGGTVALGVGVALFAAGGLMIAQSGIDALFFARYGVSRLPVMYLALGGTMLLCSLGVGVLLGRVGRGRAFILLPLAFVVIAVAGRIGLAAGATWLFSVMWLVGGVGQFMQGVFVWGLAGLVTDTRRAKRVFPLIGAGSVVGQIVGGLVTKPLASFLGAENLILVWAGAFGVVALVAYRLVATRARAAMRPDRSRRSMLADVQQGFNAVRRSPLLRWLALGSVLFSLLFFSLYLPFSRAATLRYPNPDQLAGFFGVFYAASTAVALIVSLFVTNRILARYGVPAAMLILPVLYVAAFGAIVLRTTFAVLAVARFVQIVWMQGGAGSATEAVINTVPPDRRDQTRAFIYGGPTQGGTILAGIVALVGAHQVSARLMTTVGLVAAIACVLAMEGVRRAYPRELVTALREGRPHVFGASASAGSIFGPDEATAVAVAAKAASDPDPRVRRLAAHMLGELAAPAAHEALRRAMEDDDPEVRVTAAASIARSGSAAAGEWLTRALDDPDARVRVAALNGLRVIGEDRVDARRCLRDQDASVRAAAAAYAISRGEVDAMPIVHELAAASDPLVRAAAYDALAAASDAPAFDDAMKGLRDPDASVRAAAVRAVAAIDPARSIEPLIEAIADRSDVVRAAVADAVGKLGDGARDRLVASLALPERASGALDALAQVPLDGATPEIRRFATDSVGRALMDHRIASSIAGDDDPSRMLRDSLLERARRTARDALRAAALLGDRPGIDVALENLSVADPAQRANALEVIEAVGDPDIVRPLLALWEPRGTAGSESDWRERLQNDQDPWIRACVTFAAERTEGDPMTKTLTTLTPVERVMFLRRVSLFAELPPQDLEPVAAIADEHAFADGDVIAEQGDPGDAMHIIVGGTVRVVAGGTELAVRGEGDVIGEMAVITSRPRMATLVASGPVRVLSIDRRQFSSILRERPETALGVMRVLCDRLQAGVESHG